MTDIHKQMSNVEVRSSCRIILKNPNVNEISVENNRFVDNSDRIGILMEREGRYQQFNLLGECGNQGGASKNLRKRKMFILEFIFVHFVIFD